MRYIDSVYIAYTGDGFSLVKDSKKGITQSRKLSETEITLLIYFYNKIKEELNDTTGIC